MPVILLDPALPDMIPVGALSSIGGHLYVTEDVNPSLLWYLPSYEFAGADKVMPRGAMLLSSDREHPLVREHIARGEMVVAGGGLKGTRLLEAVALMDRLRATGPWERKQTHDSLRRYLLEEVYELLDAFDTGDDNEIRSELGDLLLQVLFHARIAEDSGTAPFDIDDVAAGFIKKVSYRTPGVLAGEHVDLERQIREWEERKAAERNRGSVLDGLVTTQPVLALTQKIFERLAAADFPRDAISPSIFRVDVPYGKHSRDSVEDLQRRNVRTLIDQVHAAEAAAAAAGELPRDENTWRRFLGMTYKERSAPQPVIETPVEAAGPVGVVRPRHSASLPPVDSVSTSTASVDTSPFAAAPFAAATVGTAPAVTVPVTDASFATGRVAAASAGPGFPEVEDFPGPPAPLAVVSEDPIGDSVREVPVSYGDYVPEMVVHVEQS